MTDSVTVGLNVLLVGLAAVIIAQCYRGYTRNGSRPLVFLGAGIGLITLPSFVVYIVVSLTTAPAYVDLLVLTQVGGLVAILYAFRGA